jgi:hypothetical protein
MRLSSLRGRDRAGFILAVALVSTAACSGSAAANIRACQEAEHRYEQIKAGAWTPVSPLFNNK